MVESWRSAHVLAVCSVLTDCDWSHRRHLVPLCFILLCSVEFLRGWLVMLSCFQSNFCVCTPRPPSSPHFRAIRIPARKATKAELASVHTESFVDLIVDDLPGFNARDRRLRANGWNSVYLSEATTDCALLAAGSTVALTEAVRATPFTLTCP